MKVRLLVDRPGCPRGSVVAMPDEEARALCDVGAAVVVPPGTLVDLVLPVTQPATRAPADDQQPADEEG